jgi:hypothetical protein
MGSTQYKYENTKMPAVDKTIVNSNLNEIQMLLKSKNGEKKNVTFINVSPVDLNVYWMDYDGNEIFYFNLNKFKNQVQNTFVNHIWVFREAKTKNIFCTKKIAENSEVILKEEEYVYKYWYLPETTGFDARQLLRTFKRKDIFDSAFEDNILNEYFV